MDVVKREIRSEKPLRVHYSLTNRGEELEPLIAGMVHWGTGESANGDSPQRLVVLSWCGDI